MKKITLFILAIFVSINILLKPIMYVLMPPTKQAQLMAMKLALQALF